MPRKKAAEMEAEQKARLVQDFIDGKSLRAWQFLGAHAGKKGKEEGYTFRVWAPHAAAAAVVGDFNGWDPSANLMEPIGGGIWEGFVPGLERYDNYKFALHTRDGKVLFKADPYAFHAETRPGTASKIYDLWGYDWGDAAWLGRRKANPVYTGPLNIYECHLGSWRCHEGGERMGYRDIAGHLVPYLKEMGYTHVEFMPLTEYPLDESWGYQVTGYFAATSRYGTPSDLKYLIDQLHQAGIGVILDWVPAHFPRDAFGLYMFDGEPCFEYADWRKGEHKEWGTMVFDFGRNEVRSFLYSSAMFWLEEYHIDGLRVDAVASMLYLDYNRQGGEWLPNIHGGHENLEAVEFLQYLNQNLFGAHDDIMVIAEESTAWPKVTHPVSEGGLGFNLKWNMGWMNDITHYMKLDPYFRQYNHHDITFSLMYAFSENFILPLSHDEVVHMKGSFLNKMPGEYLDKFTGVRVFYTYMLTHPGKKLTMMGSELGQWNEWHYERSLDWNLLDDNEENRQIHAFFKALNNFYLAHKELWEKDFSWEGFEWINADDNEANTVSFIRKDAKGNELVILCNFSPVDRTGYTVGVNQAGSYACVFNSDDAAYGGQGRGDKKSVRTKKSPCNGKDHSLTVTLPPMSAVIYQRKTRAPAKKTAAAAEKKPAEQKAPAKKAAAAEKKPAAKKAAAKPAAPKAKSPVKKSTAGKTEVTKKA